MSERQTAQSAPSYALLTRLHAKASAELAEAEAALAAVGASEVDALITRSGRHVELLTLPEPDSHPEFFRTLVAAMQEGAASLDAGGTVLYANARLAELLGIALERIVGRALGELAADVSGPEVRRLLAQASRGPARTSLELRRGDGQTMPVEVSAAPLLAGERGELCLLVTDVTLKRLGEARLRRERAALDQAQAIGGVGSWEWDLDSGESRWSAEQFRLHGLDPAGIAPPQQEYAARVHPEDRAALLASWADYGRQRREGVDEYRYEHPTLGTRTLRMHSDFLAAQADDGQPARLAGTCQDVTDERAAQSALQAAVARDVTERKRRELEQQTLMTRMRSMIVERTRELRSTTGALEVAEAEIVRRLSMAVEWRDDDTGQHIDRVSRLSGELARRAGLAPELWEPMRFASPLHDAGKVAIPDAILLKPGRLTPQERAVMETHAELGYELLRGSASPILELAATIARTHHEKYDGSGYPRGLTGDDIPIEGRIVAVVDVFDALTSDRVYRPAFSVEAALSMMVADRGTHFDPRLLDVFLETVGDVASGEAR